MVLKEALVSQVYLDLKETRVLFLFPSESLGRGVHQVHWVSEDHQGTKVDQAHRAPLEIMASWDPLGRKVCRGSVVNQEHQGFVERRDQRATPVCKAWKVAVATLVSQVYQVCQAAVSAWDTCW